jgi:hypothetical protein
MKISDKTAISMPMRNLISIVIAISVGVWSYFGIVERLNKHQTTLELMSKDLEQNTEFRIKYPSKRLAMREVNPQSVIFKCEKLKVETEIYMGAKKIVKVIND